MLGSLSLQLQRICKCFLVCSYKVRQVLQHISISSRGESAGHTHSYEDLSVLCVHDLWLADTDCI